MIFRLCFVYCDSRERRKVRVFLFYKLQMSGSFGTVQCEKKGSQVKALSDCYVVQQRVVPTTEGTKGREALRIQ